MTEPYSGLDSNVKTAENMTCLRNAYVVLSTCQGDSGFHFYLKWQCWYHLYPPPTTNYLSRQKPQSCLCPNLWPIFVANEQSQHTLKIHINVALSFQINVGVPSLLDTRNSQFKCIRYQEEFLFSWTDFLDPCPTSNLKDKCCFLSDPLPYQEAI